VCGHAALSTHKPLTPQTTPLPPPKQHARQAFPYIAKRLMTDDSPRLREALRYMVYGKDGEAAVPLKQPVPALLAVVRRSGLPSGLLRRAVPCLRRFPAPPHRLAGACICVAGSCCMPRVRCVLVSVFEAGPQPLCYSLLALNSEGRFPPPPPQPLGRHRV
jgi:hypothetical protein